jgi:hypothetical protein
MLWPNEDTGALVWGYLADHYARTPGVAPLLQERALHSAAALILDGLDEVGAGSDGEPLCRVRAAIEALAHRRT